MDGKINSKNLFEVLDLERNFCNRFLTQRHHDQKYDTEYAFIEIEYFLSSIFPYTNQALWDDEFDRLIYEQNLAEEYYLELADEFSQKHWMSWQLPEKEKETRDLVEFLKKILLTNQVYVENDKIMITCEEKE